MSGKKENDKLQKVINPKKIRKEVEKRAEVLVELFSDGEYRSYKEISVITGYDHPNRAMTAVRQAGYNVEAIQCENPETGYNTLVKVRITGKIPGKEAIVRTSITKKDKRNIFIRDKLMCNMCKETFQKGDLRPDHRRSFIKHGETVNK